MSAVNLPAEAEGWDVILPHKRDKQRNRIRPVTLMARGKGRRAAALTITINPAGFPEGHLPHWLQVGANIWVTRGRGEFLDTLRLLPNGPTPVGRAARSTTSLKITIKPQDGHTIKPQDGHPEQGAPRTDVAFDYSDRRFDITLPDWHGPVRLKSPAELKASLDKLVEAARPGATPAACKPTKPFTLAAGAASHPAWVSPKAQAEHKRAVEGGGA